ncbi:hypothetical protein BDP55DRAFT_768239 [Colletotrichum godetiae]|uniref:BTB domain-containing protein n=1 Tax=Colletotrichum godetiae TaxID=1209918 RepID=A0AAJ0ALE5_9PEZI|nr:uncharacterized protein BDP55DRAFT_768239 [Colletotrichum godetiae]KAK1676065.1 hypothetical protein BDP55DRAFT_768239 [Colletotrichum godetiae]
MTSTHTNEQWQSVNAKIPSNRIFDFRKDGSMSLDSFRINSRPPDLGFKAIVSKKKMGEASKRFSDPKRRQKLEYDLAKDHLAPIMILLDIAHGSGIFVPKMVTAIELEFLVIHAHMYELEHLLRPYLKLWMPSKEERLGAGNCCDCVAWVALEIGNDEVYNEMISHLAFCSGVDEGGNIISLGSSTDLLKGRYKFIDKTEIPDAVTELRTEYLRFHLKQLKKAIAPEDNNRVCVADKATPFGNLKDGSVVEFVVCSRALARASSVFRAMLLGGFSESKPERDDWVVELPEVRTAPFSILLKIIHGRFCEVPQSLTLEELYQLLVVTDKYDMVSVIFQLASTWFEP